MANKYDKILGEYRESDVGKEPNLLFLKINQTTPQNVVSGAPQFDEGITIKADKWVYLDGV